MLTKLVYCQEQYLAITGNLEQGNKFNNYLHEGTLKFLANHYGSQQASNSVVSVLDEHENSSKENSNREPGRINMIES